MSEEEHRINLNQLNVHLNIIQRAVEGRYAKQGYIDRSIGSIGDGKKIDVNLIEDKVQEDQNSLDVKLRLEEMKKRMQRQRLF